MPIKKQPAASTHRPLSRTPRKTRKPLPRHQARQLIRADRSWHQRILLHPLSMFALLVVGVLMVGLTMRAAADDYSVQATVSAPPLAAGALISIPSNNQIFSNHPIDVSGSCPNDSYIKLSRNGMFSGVAICNNGSFKITTDLFAGQNDLQAQDYTITDEPGPSTAVVRVTYQPPASAGTTGTGIIFMFIYH